MTSGEDWRDPEFAEAQFHRLLGPPPAREKPGVGDAEALFRRVTAYRWRRSSVDAAAAADLRMKIRRQADAAAPIKFSVPFSGSKAWHQDSYPHPGWAEAMWIERLRSFGATIAEIHPPGVTFDLSYYSNALDIVNNIPPDDQQAYVDELAVLLAARSGSGVRFALVDLAALHGSAADFRRDFLAAIEDAGATPVSPDRLASARRNLMPAGVRDLAALPQPELDREFVASARSVIALEGLPQRREFNKFGERIQVGHIRGPALMLHLGSTQASTMQPWVGSGYLAPSGRGWVDTIASRIPECVEVSMPQALPGLGPAFAALPVGLAQQQFLRGSSAGPG